MYITNPKGMGGGIMEILDQREIETQQVRFQILEHLQSERA